MTGTAPLTVDCIVVGAGLAGLTAAQRLRDAGLTPLLLERGRRVGGRLATERFPAGATDAAAAAADAGAQFFTVRHAAFQAIVDLWLARRLVDVWTHGFSDAENRRRADGHPRYRARNGMDRIAAALSDGLVIRLNTTVVEVSEVAGEQWQVTDSEGHRYQAPALLLTPPPPLATALVGSLIPPAAAATLAGLSYDPCLALLAPLDGPSAVPPPGAVQIDGEPLAWVADNSQKGLATTPALTIHAGPGFSQANWAEPDPIIAEKLLAAAAPWLGAARATQWRLRRWPYSRPRVVHPERCLVAVERPWLGLAGDAYGEPRVEGAALSGLAAADALLAANTA